MTSFFSSSHQKIQFPIQFVQLYRSRWLPEYFYETKIKTLDFFNIEIFVFFQFQKGLPLRALYLRNHVEAQRASYCFILHYATDLKFDKNWTKNCAF